MFSSNALTYLFATCLLALGLLLLARLRTLRRAIAIFGAGASAVCAFLAQVTARAEYGCRGVLAATLRWPPRRFVRAADGRQASPARVVVGAAGHMDPVLASASPTPEDGAQTEPQTQTQTQTLPPFAPSRPVTAASTVAWPGYVILARLMYLTLILCIICGEYAINQMRSPAVQFGIAVTSSAPMLDVFASLLWLAMALFWGALLLELLDVVPVNVQIFPFLPERVRRVFLTITACCCLVTVLNVGLLYLAGQLLVDGAPLPYVAEILSFLQGILLTAAVIPGGFALLLGMLGLLGLVCALLVIALATLRHLFHFAGQLCAFVTSAPAPPLATLTPLEQAIGDEQRLASAAAPAVLGALSRTARGRDDDANEEIGEDIHMDSRITTIMGNGGAGTRLVPPLFAALAELRGLQTLRAVGVVHPSRLSEVPPPLLGTQRGIRAVSPTRDQVQAALEAAGPDGAYDHLLKAITDEIVAANAPGQLGDGQILWIDEVDRLNRSAPALHALKKRLEGHTIVLVVTMDELGMESRHVEEGLKQVRGLRAEEVIAAAILVCLPSSLSMDVGEEWQERLLVRWLAAMLVAHDQDPHNPRLAEAALALGREGPVTALALGSADVASGPSPVVYGAWRGLFGGPRRGPGDVVDLVKQAQELTQRLMRPGQACTVAADVAVPEGGLHLFTFVTPLHHADARFRLVSDQMQTSVLRLSRTGRAIVVSGSGSAHSTPAHAPAPDYALLAGRWFSLGSAVWPRDIATTGADTRPS